jgi:1,4-alpha-glucan branching enzyme
MTSLSFLTSVSLYPNNFIQFQSQHRQQRLTFPRQIKIICSATEQPKQPPQQHPKKKKSVAESGKGVDPVGFLTKLGISNKAFAMFLRERYKQDIREKKVKNK